MHAPKTLPSPTETMDTEGYSKPETRFLNPKAMRPEYKGFPLLDQDVAAIIVSKLAYMGDYFSACDGMRNWCDTFGCSDDLLAKVAFNLGIKVENPELYNGWRGVMKKWCQAHMMKREESDDDSESDDDPIHVLFYRPDEDLQPVLVYERITNNHYNGIHPYDKSDIIHVFYKGPKGKEKPMCIYVHAKTSFWYWFKDTIPIGRFDDFAVIGNLVMEFDTEGVLSRFVTRPSYEYGECDDEIWKWDTLKREIKVYGEWSDTDSADVIQTYQGDEVPEKTPTFPAPPPTGLCEAWKAIMLGKYKPPSMPDSPGFLPSRH